MQYRFGQRLLFAAILVSCFAVAPALQAQWIPLNPVKSADPLPDGLLLTLENGYLRLEVCSDSIIHVVYSLDRTLPARTDVLVVKKDWAKAAFTVHSDDPKLLRLATSELTLEVSRADSIVVFYDSARHRLTQENTRTLTPVEVNGEKTTPNASPICGTRRKPSMASASIKRASGTTVAKTSRFRRTTPTFPSRSSFRATATASSGTTARAAVSTTVSCTPCI
jgi:hypothetical protein